MLPSLIAPPLAIVNDHVFELHCKWCMKYDLSRHLSSFLCDIPWYDLWHRLGILCVFQNERRGRKRGSVKLWGHVNTYVISSLLRARNCHLSPPYSVTAREQERAGESVCVSKVVYFSPTLSAQVYPTCHWGADAVLFFSITPTWSLMNVKFMYF